MNLKPAIIISIIIILITSSTIVIMTNNKKSSSDTPKTSDSNNMTELYAFYSSNDIAGNMTKVMSNGKVFNYTMPEASLNYSLNESIDVSFMIINHENEDLNYRVSAYQAIPDSVNNTFNMTYLYDSSIGMLKTNEYGRYSIQVKPAFIASNAIIGITIYNGSLSNCTKIYNNTYVYANVFGE
jgi:hypothetical protein